MSYFRRHLAWKNEHLLEGRISPRSIIFTQGLSQKNHQKRICEATSGAPNGNRIFQTANVTPENGDQLAERISIFCAIEGGGKNRAAPPTGVRATDTTGTGPELAMRKPAVGMWELFIRGAVRESNLCRKTSTNGGPESVGPAALSRAPQSGKPVREVGASPVSNRSFYCGDAAGRFLRDRSGADREFARNIDLDFVTEEAVAGLVASLVVREAHPSIRAEKVPGQLTGERGALLQRVAAERGAERTGCEDFFA